MKLLTWLTIWLLMWLTSIQFQIAKKNHFHKELYWKTCMMLLSHKNIYLDSLTVIIQGIYSTFMFLHQKPKKTPNVNLRNLQWKFHVFTIFSFWKILPQIFMRDHSFSTYAKFPEKLTFLTDWYAHLPVRIRE